MSFLKKRKQAVSFQNNHMDRNQGKLRISQHLKKVRQKGKGKTRVC